MGKTTVLITVIQNDREKRCPWSFRMLKRTSNALFLMANLGSDVNEDNPESNDKKSIMSLSCLED